LPDDCPEHYQEKSYITRGQGLESFIEEMAMIRANARSGIANANDTSDSQKAS
jgi:hypothetical protein